MKSYGQFCPVAKAAEILTEKWTLLILRDLLGGSRHFNELRKGVPLMSPSLLSKRLKSLEAAGVIERRRGASVRATEYHLTAAGHEVLPIILLFGSWGQRWVRNRLDDDEALDVGLLMWAIVMDFRGGIDTDFFHGQRTVVQFEFTDITGPKKMWWLIIEPSQADLCIENPGFDIDLYVTTDLSTLTGAWMGDMPMKQALASGAIELHGSGPLARGFDKWMRRSPFAQVEMPPEPMGYDQLLKMWSDTTSEDAASR